MAVDDGLVEEQQETGAADFFDTPELEVPAKPPEAHRATITAVSLKRVESRDDWPVIEIALVSRDVPTLDDKLGVFVPKGYAESISNGAKFDPKQLREEKGNYWTEERTMFARNVANSEKTAVLQKLVFNPDSVARKAGRDPVQLGLARPHTLDEYVENINKMLSGVECIMLLRERGGDDSAFKHQLRVRELLSPEEFDVNPKRFKKYRLAWSEE